MHIFFCLMILIVEFNKIHDNCMVGIIAEVLKFDSYWWCQLQFFLHSCPYCGND